MDFEEQTAGIYNFFEGAERLPREMFLSLYNIFGVAPFKYLYFRARCDILYQIIGQEHI